MEAAAIMPDHVEELKRHFDRRFDAQDARLDRIEAHTERTNGRVTKLEIWQARMQGMGGSWAVFVAGSGVVFGAASLVYAIANGG